MKLSYLPVEVLDQEHRDRRHVGADEQDRQEHGDEPEVGLRHLPDVGARDGAGDDQHAGDRRGLLADGQVESHDQAEVNRIDRSEEHTSELQSLMRISYAVFCLKKKKIKKT